MLLRKVFLVPDDHRLNFIAEKFSESKKKTFKSQVE